MTPEVKPHRIEPPGRDLSSLEVTAPRPATGAPAPSQGTHAPEEARARLRAIIIGREREALRRLERRFEDPATLAPAVERALTASVRRDPRPLANALFPVMGPAIRRAISQALAGMMQSVNSGLEQSFSLKGLAWRWEALRSGTSFAEVVLRHTLLYRVEQVFLVHRESGLLLQHLTAPAIAAQSPDMVAGMLTALQDFARDSFQVAQEEMLETMQVGGLTVWIEQGGHSLLAAVIRGHAPMELRAELQRTLEEIEAEHGPELRQFSGDASQFGRSRPKLEALLLAEARGAGAAARRPWRTWIILGIAIALILLLGIPALLRQDRWDRYVARLREEPGVVVTHATRESGRFVIRGLRDPLAGDPQALLPGFRLDTGMVRAQWQPYVALLPGFVLRRAERALAPPGSITLQMAGDTLTAAGAASEWWFSRAAGMAPALSGVGTYVEERIAPRDLPAFAPLVDELEARRVLFGSGAYGLDSAAIREAEALAVELGRLDSLARSHTLSVHLVLAGSADDVGDEPLNEQLRWLRAGALRDRLAPLLPPTLTVSIASLPAAAGEASGDTTKVLRRSVRAQLQLTVPEAEAQP
jgi:OOP family OmpA-OmpF porin